MINVICLAPVSRLCIAHLASLSTLIRRLMSERIPPVSSLIDVRYSWTNPETNRLVEILSRSSTYQKIFFPPPGQRSDDNEGRYERELCLRILDRTAWMDWMIKSGWVERDDRGRPFGKSFWNESSCPVTHRLRWSVLSKHRVFLAKDMIPLGLIGSTSDCGDTLANPDVRKSCLRGRVPR